MSEITRTEKFLRACIDGEPCKLKPLTRVEKLLAELNDKLAGGPSEVVILPETEMTYNDGVYHTTALQAMPEAGKTYAATYNGTVYDCPAVAFEMSGVSGVAMGNTDAYGIPGGNANAPFILTCMQDGEVMGAELVPTDSPASVTLSVVEKAETASAGGGVLVVNVTCDTDDSFSSYTNATKDKSYAEIKAVYDAGGIVQCRLSYASGPVAGMMVLECRLSGVVTAGETTVFWFEPNLGGAPGANSVKISSDDTLTVEYD